MHNLYSKIYKLTKGTDEMFLPAPPPFIPPSSPQRGNVTLSLHNIIPNDPNACYQQTFTEHSFMLMTMISMFISKKIITFPASSSSSQYAAPCRTVANCLVNSAGSLRLQRRRRVPHLRSVQP